MPNTRTKVVNTSIDDGRATFNCYSDPANGEQTITDTYAYDVRNYPTPVIYNLAAFGLVAVAGNRYQRTAGFPNVPNTLEELNQELVNGEWQPGKRDTGPSEPTDLMRALAEATGTPVHVVQHKFETDMTTVNFKSQTQDPHSPLFRDRAGKTRKFYNTKLLASLTTDIAIAPILARIQQERAKATLASLKGNKQPSQLSSLFAISEQQEAAQ